MGSIPNSAINLLRSIGGTAAAMFDPQNYGQTPAIAKKRKVSYGAGIQSYFDILRMKRKAFKELEAAQ